MISWSSISSCKKAPQLMNYSYNSSDTTQLEGPMVYLNYPQNTVDRTVIRYFPLLKVNESFYDLGPFT
jgi:hypothetical protein